MPEKFRVEVHDCSYNSQIWPQNVTSICLEYYTNIRLQPAYCYTHPQGKNGVFIVIECFVLYKKSRVFERVRPRWDILHILIGAHCLNFKENSFYR